MIDKKVKQTILTCMYNALKDKIYITYFNFLDTDNPCAYLDIRTNDNKYIEKVMYDRLRNLDLFKKIKETLVERKIYKLKDLISEKEFCQGTTMFEILGIEGKYTNDKYF